MYYIVMNIDEKVIQRNTVYTGRIVNVEALKTELPDGNIAGREVVRHGGGASIVALTENGDVFLVEQWRVSFEKVMLELPAGKLEPGEEKLVCAQRELTEETGLSARKWRHLIDMAASPGYLTEIIGVFLATDLTYGAAHLDDGEFLSVRRLPLKEAMDMVMRGEIVDAKTAVGLLMTAHILDTEG